MTTSEVGHSNGRYQAAFAHLQRDRGVQIEDSTTGAFPLSSAVIYGRIGRLLSERYQAIRSPCAEMSTVEPGMM